MNILPNQKKQEWIDNNYGLKTKEHYEPWLSERAFTGQGTLIILKNCSFKRNHILFSKLQEKVLLCLLYQDDVVDIREHYPIFTGQDKVICTTFLVTRKIENKYIDEAITVIREINNHYKNRLLLQEKYWREKGVVYRVITEKDMLNKENRIYNYKLFYSMKSNGKQVNDMFQAYKGFQGKVSEIISQFKTAEKLQAIESLKYNIVHGKIEINWDKEFNLDSQIYIL